MDDQERRADDGRDASRQRRRRALIALIPILAAALFVTLSDAIPRLFGPRESTEDPAREEATQPIDVPIGPAVGQKAPEFSLHDLDGAVISLSDYQGSVVILDFWASWCGPCKATFPATHSLWESFADRGVVLVGVSLDRREEDARGYLAETGFGDMVALWGSLPAATAVASAYGVGGIPHTFVIDREGIVRFAGHPAYLRSGTLSEIVD